MGSKVASAQHGTGTPRHRETEHSDDLEMLEITSPAEFATETAGPDL
jgi:hypothetical protein